MENSFVAGIKKQFEYYKTIGDKTFNQLTFEELAYQFDKDSNSISIIVKHMVGNMLSRWTNFLTEDGEKSWRQREQEFEASYTNKKELIASWETGWDCLFKAIEPLEDVDLNNIVYIRNEGHTVAEAIFRQLGHYSYHVGQITYLGKMVKGNEWQTLSIAKGGTAAFNADKFNTPKV
jgi:hypothetical protein